ncbi:MAG: heme NO-binding domain-containing protein [Phycisphaerae bacterium]|nr:heme NO-binding domain-containing protein [Phycisphaerae bacterium]
MKGVILASLADLVTTKFGKDKWADILKKSEINEKARFLPVGDYPDKDVLKIVRSLCEVLHVSPAQAGEAFGDYWVNTYAPKMYSQYYARFKSAREFLLGMDEIHKNINVADKQASPPRFAYSWKDDKTLLMKYKSSRNLIDIFVGLVKGVGKHFHETLRVTHVGNNVVQIVFPK